MQEASGKMIQYRTQVIKRIPVNEYFASRNCRCSRLVIDHVCLKMKCITLSFSVTKRMLACSSRLRSERAGKKGLWSRITSNNYDYYCARNYCTDRNYIQKKKKIANDEPPNWWLELSRVNAFHKHFQDSGIPCRVD